MSAGGFFPELFKKLAATPPRRRQGPQIPGTLRLRTTPSGPLNPCAGCPREQGIKVLPTIPPTAKLICIGMGLGAEEERKGRQWVGPGGIMLREALGRAGVNPDTEVGYANLARCRPEHDDFDSPAWQQAERRCWHHLTRDLAGAPSDARYLLLGTRPVQRFFGSKDDRIGYWRGLWGRTPGGQVVYAARHPAQILRTPNERARNLLAVQFQEDIDRLARALRGTPRDPLKTLEIHTDPEDARPLLAWITALTDAWGFDIEAYDAQGCPAREGVATDPCHPDFRIRGVAIAWAWDEGAWFEVMGGDWRAWSVALTPAFDSPAPKAAFGGHYDEEGLIYSGLVPRVRNRSLDGMLFAIALGDGRQSSYRLERLVVDVLKQEQYWNAFDKNRIQDAPLDMLAESAVRDAAGTLWLCDYLQSRMRAREYLSAF